MATVKSDKQVVEVFVTKAEMSTLLGEKAQASGLVTFVAEEVDLFQSPVPDPVDPDLTVDGWTIVLQRASTP